MSDPVTKELAKIVSSNAVQPTKKFMGRIAGPAADEIGERFRDSVKLYRYRNQLKLLDKARHMTEEAGYSPKAVPIKTLFPLLEYASLEEDDSMQDRWAALLAHAANPEEATDVRPAYMGILRELTPTEAKLLDAYYDYVSDILVRQKFAPKPENLGLLSPNDVHLLGRLYVTAVDSPIPWDLTLTHGYEATEVNRQHTEFSTALGNLLRQHLVSVRTRVGFDRSRYEQNFGALPKSLEQHEEYSITSLGFQFVTVCRKPPPKDATEKPRHHTPRQTPTAPGGKLRRSRRFHVPGFSASSLAAV